MADTVLLELPADIARATGLSPDELRLELAVHLYSSGKLSWGKAKALSALNAWEWQDLLGKRSIPFQYGDEDLENDVVEARRAE